LRAAAVLFWLAIWQLGSMAVDQEILLVSPLNAFRTLIELLGERSFYAATFGSLLRILIGFLLGFFLGILFSAFAKIARPVRILFEPLMAAIKATPVASFVILSLIWISSTNLSIFMSLLIVLPAVYQNVLDGLDRADKKLLEMADVFGLAFGGRVRAIYAPAAFPYLLTAAKLSLGMCWKAGIAAEVIAQPKNSIGTALQRAKVFFSTPELFAWTLAIIVISVLFEKAAVLLINRLSRRLYD
jgi:NitT/TauT family transport system permease protein